MKHEKIDFVLIIATILLMYILSGFMSQYARGQEVVLTATVPERHQTWAIENCLIPEWPVCFKMISSSVGEPKVDTESLDLTTGQFMRTWWLDTEHMVRNIEETDGSFSCDVMSSGDDIVYEQCDLETISILIGLSSR